MFELDPSCDDPTDEGNWIFAVAHN